jgi:hypothetical protein
MKNLNHAELAAGAFVLLLFSGGCVGTVVNDRPSIPPRSTAATPAVPADHAFDDDDPDSDLDPAPLMNAGRTPTVLPRG